MLFEWDEAKDQANHDKHGIRFAEAVQIFRGITLTIPDDRRDYGEPRFRTLGEYEGMIFSIIHTPRPPNTRIISARFAKRQEREAYHAHCHSQS